MDVLVRIGYSTVLTTVLYLDRPDFLSGIHSNNDGDHCARPLLQDQRILEILLAKKEAERQQEAEREKARAKWQQEQQRTSAAQSTEKNHRRKTLMEERKQRQVQRVSPC